MKRRHTLLQKRSLAWLALGFALLANAAGSQPKSGRSVGHTNKLAAPIVIEHAFSAEPVVGQPVVVTLTIGSGADLTDARLVLAADEALAVTAPAGEVALADPTPESPAEVEVTVVPLAGGTSYLRVTVTATIRGRVQSRSIAVPFRLPGGELRTSDDGEAGKGEESVRSFKAVEDIR